MEYSKRYKNGQGAELEIKIRAECVTTEDTYDALRLISVGSHYFYREMTKTWGRAERLDIESLVFFLEQLKGVSASVPDKEGKFIEAGCNLLLKQIAGLGDEWLKDLPQRERC